MVTLKPFYQPASNDGYRLTVVQGRKPFYAPSQHTVSLAVTSFPDQ